MVKDKKIIKVKISKSPLPKKKLTAVFYNKEGKIVKTQHFGAAGYSDYTINKDDERKARYLARHKKREDWNDFTSAGSLSRWILWEEKNYNTAKKKYKKRFNLK